MRKRSGVVDVLLLMWLLWTAIAAASAVLPLRLLAGDLAEARRARAEARAERDDVPLTLDAFNAQYPAPPDDANLYQELDALHDAIQNAMRDKRYGEWEMNGDPGPTGLPTGDNLTMAREGLAAQADANAMLDKLIARLDPAVASPRAVWPRNKGGGEDLVSDLLPELNSLREIAIVMKLRALVQASNGNHVEALRTCRAIVGLADAGGEGRTLVQSLTSTGVRALAADACDRVTTSISPGDIDEELREAMEQTRDVLLRSDHVRDSFIRNLRGEVVFGLDLIRTMKTGAIDATETGPARSFTRATFWLLDPMFDHERANYLNVLLDFIAAANDRPTMHAFEEAFDEDKRIKAMEDAILPSPFALLILPTMTNSATSQYAVEARETLVGTMLAIRLYQADHGGELPASLEDLVDTYLPAIPMDATSAGEPLHYDADRGRRWTLGRDGKNDNGHGQADHQRKNPGSAYLRENVDDVVELR